MSRIYLSPPDVGVVERSSLLEAFDSNWIAPVGDHLDRFEHQMAAECGVGHAVALSSGTAALHLALLLAGIGPGDEVLVPTLTFVATANAVGYVGAEPVFVDSEQRSWGIDADLVDAAISERAGAGRMPAAVLTVDLYGQCCDYDALAAVCGAHGVPIIEDAAEAVGATHRLGPAGSLGRLAGLSFNGNKILTTGGGGMLLTDDAATADRARFLATQARELAVHYEHAVVGFNYRMSNLLAAVGLGQLTTLHDRIAKRAEVRRHYEEAFADVEGIALAPIADWGTPNHWLTVVTIDPVAFGETPAQISTRLDALDIEARPAWKPMHLQPLYSGAPVVGGAVAERIFATGLCLPSGSNLTSSDQERVIDALLAHRGRTAA